MSRRVRRDGAGVLRDLLRGTRGSEPATLTLSRRRGVWALAWDWCSPATDSEAWSGRDRVSKRLASALVDRGFVEPASIGPVSFVFALTEAGESAALASLDPLAPPPSRW